MSELRVSAVALRDEDGRVLIARRLGKLDGLWEFPGGKQEVGETPEGCAVRELGEELGLDTAMERTLLTFPYQEGEKRLLFTLLQGKVLGGSSLTLRVHGDARWVYPHELAKYPLCPADARMAEQMQGKWGLVLRPSNPEEAEQIALIYVKAWQHAYRGIVPQAYLDQLSPARWSQFIAERPNANAVAEWNGQPVAASCYAPARDERFIGMGEIISLYALPEMEGKGFGSAMMRYVLRQLKKAGFHQACLWVLEQNAHAIGFYEHMGFAPTGERTSCDIAGAALAELQYRIKL